MWWRRLLSAEQEVNRIFRESDAVELENRMVAQSLEVRYEAILAEQQRLNEAYEQFCGSVPKQLSTAEWDRVRTTAQNISWFWDNDRLDGSTCTAITSLMIERIVVTQHGNSEQRDIKIHWHGEHVSREQMRTPIRQLGQPSFYESLCRRVPELDSEESSRQEIAGTLNAEGYRPQRRKLFKRKFGEQPVRQVSTSVQGVGSSAIPPSDQITQEWTIAEFADLLYISIPTAYNWVATSVVSARREGGNTDKNRRWLIFADQAEVKRLKGRRKTATNRSYAREKEWDHVKWTRE